MWAVCLEHQICLCKIRGTEQIEQAIAEIRFQLKKNGEILCLAVLDKGIERRKDFSDFHLRRANLSKLAGEAGQKQPKIISSETVYQLASEPYLYCTRCWFLCIKLCRSGVIMVCDRNRFLHVNYHVCS